MDARAATIWVLVNLMYVGSCLASFHQTSLKHDDENSDICRDIIEKNGYPCVEYTVVTEDGFLLGLHRIPHGRGGELIDVPPKPAVFLQHGLLQGGDAWILNQPDESLGFIMADEGFDVWIGNGRCTRWSHGHVFHSKEDKEYWDWTWDELAAYDIPALLQFVYRKSGSQIFYVGHSQGTIIALAAFSQSVVTQYLRGAALLSPITYLDHITSSFVNTAAHMYIDKLVKTMGMHEFNLRNEIGVELVDKVCSEKGVDCGDFLTSITGPNCCFNNTRIPFYLQFEPHSTSLKNLAHLAQMIRKGTFCKYDYGILGNLKHYLKISPPAYHLSGIPDSIPLWLSWGGNDALADGIDIARTLAELPRQPQTVYLDDYGHLDFITSTRARTDLYYSMITFFRSHNGLLTQRASFSF